MARSSMHARRGEMSTSAGLNRRATRRAIATTLLIGLALSGCQATTAPPASPAWSSPPSSAPAARVSARPTIGPSGLPGQTPLPSCPTTQPLTVASYMSADERCFTAAPIQVVGWVERVREDEVASNFATYAMRSDLATAAVVQSLYLNPIENSQVDLPNREQWVEASLQRDPASGARCGWQLAGIDPPTHVCVSLAVASASRILTPPPAALAGCPSATAPLGVDVFSLLPPACFGAAKVTLTGWLGVAYVIGDWDVPYGLDPSWLWSPGIGEFSVVSPDSNALNRLAVQLHFRPGSPLAHAAVDRWVNLTGHLADPAASTCHWYFFDPTASPAPDAKPDDASARADCVESFVVDAISDGQP